MDWKPILTLVIAFIAGYRISAWRRKQNKRK